MRIKLVIPATTPRWAEPTRKICEKVKDADTQVDVVTCQRGPESLECFYDAYQSMSWCLEEIERTKQQNYDAALIFTAGFPMVDGFREILEIPVYEMLEPTLLVAMSLGGKFSLITPLVSVGEGFQSRLMRLWGIESRCASVRSFDMQVLATPQDRDKMVEVFYNVAKKAVDEDGASVIVGAFAGFMDAAGALSKKLGVPVLEPVATSLKYVEAVVKLQQKLSCIPPNRKIYASPGIKKRPGFPGPYSA